MLLASLLLGCHGTEPTDHSRVPLGRPAADYTLAFVEPASEFTVVEGARLATRVSRSGGEAGLTWRVNGLRVPTCPSAEDPLACELSDLAPGPVQICVEAEGADTACVAGTVDPCTPAFWYPDTDGDGVGAVFGAIAACAGPAGAVTFPGDCDDTDPEVHPAAIEHCDGRDENCDGEVDNNAVDATGWHRDADRDGFGDPTTSTAACVAPAAHVANAADCDDTNAAANPAGIERCDGRDNNCDGEVDGATAVDATPWYRDGDSDGFGDPSRSEQACAQPRGRVADASDCDDTDATVNPAQAERCDNRDEDCDGTVDNHALDAGTWYLDGDSDGYGDAGARLRACVSPAGYIADGTDCDDADARVYPAGTELCNGHDDDCDGLTDESDALDAVTWFEDGDGDGFGDPTAALVQCARPFFGWVEDDTDCDDVLDTVFPGADETCGGTDEDCDGETDEDDAVDAPSWYLDADADGWGVQDDVTRACTAPDGRTAETDDCDDTDSSIHPGAAEACNGADDDCDAVTDEPDAIDAATWYADADADGYGDPAVEALGCVAPAGYGADATDCNDTSALAWPGATEVCDGIDDDCDGIVDEADAADASTWYLDADADTYGDASVATVACDQPATYVDGSTDCDDTDATIWPGATEHLDGLDDDCDGDVDEVVYPWETDLITNGGFEFGDLTGWVEESGSCDVVSSVDWASPYDGLYMLWGGESTDNCVVSQSFDLLALGFAADDLDSGRAAVDATAMLSNEVDVTWIATYSTFDRVFMRVRYLDASGVELGSVRTQLSEEEAWVSRGTGGVIPEGTRNLSVEIEAKLKKGESIDAVADDVSMSLTVETPTSPTLTKLPFLQDYRQDAMRLLWETDGNLAAHTVEWAPTGETLTEVVSVVDTVEIDAEHYVHVATIEGLEAGTEYDYRVGSGETWSETYTFRTAPASGEPFRIGWIGDNHNGATMYTTLLEGMQGHDVDLYMSPGDIVLDGQGVQGWEDSWFEPLQNTGFSMTHPVLFARGNHDNHRSLAYAYSALPENEDWYTFSYGNVFVVVLDSNSDTDSSVDVLNQMAYLEEALASDAALDADFRVVTFHNPPYTNSRHDSFQTGLSDARRDWVPLFESYNVDIVIGGHFHAYQRGEQNGVTYLVVGGGGGTLDTYVVSLYDLFEVVEHVNHYAVMDVDGPTLTWTVYDENEAEIDTFALTAE